MAEKMLITGIGGMIAWHVAKAAHASGIEAIGFGRVRKNSLKNHPESIESMLSDGLVSSIIDSDFSEHALIEIISRNDIKHVVHLAGSPGVGASVENPKSSLFNNQNCFINLMEAIRKTNPRIRTAYASSSSAYGDSEEPKNELSALNPLSPYAVSKINNEQVANQYFKHFGMESIGLRLFTVYGEYQRKDMLIGKLIDSCLSGKEVRLYGDGEMERDFTYAGDVGKVAVSLCLSNVEGIFNVGGGSPEKISSIAEKIGLHMGRNPKTSIIDAINGSDPKKTNCDNSKLLRLLHSFEFTNIDEGIRKTCETAKIISMRNDILQN